MNASVIVLPTSNLMVRLSCRVVWTFNAVPLFSSVSLVLLCALFFPLYVHDKLLYYIIFLNNKIDMSDHDVTREIDLIYGMALHPS